MVGVPLADLQVRVCIVAAEQLPILVRDGVALLQCSNGLLHRLWRLDLVLGREESGVQLEAGVVLYLIHCTRTGLLTANQRLTIVIHNLVCDKMPADWLLIRKL